MLDNPYLTPGINLEQAGKLDPSNADQKLEKIQEKEYALTQVMARLPINDELYANMLSELKVVAQERAEIERDYLEVKLKSDPTVVLGVSDQEKRRERIRVGCIHSRKNCRKLWRLARRVRLGLNTILTMAFIFMWTLS